MPLESPHLLPRLGCPETGDRVQACHTGSFRRAGRAVAGGKEFMVKDRPAATGDDGAPSGANAARRQSRGPRSGETADRCSPPHNHDPSWMADRARLAYRRRRLADHPATWFGFLPESVDFLLSCSKLLLGELLTLELFP